MKKSLIALAVASAVSAPAFAATSNVDIYGKLHLSVNFLNDQCDNKAQCIGVNTPANVAADGMNNVSISSNASRIGFKGTEDLGGGLAAIWQVESGVNMDEASGTWASRNTFVGLKGGWGTALVGNHDTPLKLVGRAVDLFGDTIADSRNVLGGGSDTRAKNTVAYITPDMSGFSIAAAYSTDFTGSGAATATGLAFGGAASDIANHDVFNVNATYTNGPLFLGAAYGDGDGHKALGLGAQWRLAAGYTFGNFKVVGQYDELSVDSPTLASTSVHLGGDYKAWMLGGAYTMGAMVFKANYMEGSQDTSGTLDPKQWTIGMDYNLSKRTTVYALYADAKNTALGFGAGDSDVAYGNLLSTGVIKVQALSFGVMHSF